MTRNLQENVNTAVHPCILTRLGWKRCAGHPAGIYGDNKAPLFPLYSNKEDTPKGRECGDIVITSMQECVGLRHLYLLNNLELHVLIQNFPTYGLPQPEETGRANPASGLGPSQPIHFLFLFPALFWPGGSFLPHGNLLSWCPNSFHILARPLVLGASTRVEWPILGRIDRERGPFRS